MLSRLLLVLTLTVFLAAALAAVLFGRPDADALQVARGEYLAHAMSCYDCHTPWHLGPNGPEPDPERHLSGHPEGLAMPAGPVLPEGPWTTVASATMTAWSGAWGTSFTANLTPDEETGLGKWTVEDFVATMRSGRHLGRGREILPPMPWRSVAGLSDDDLHALFAYLRSIKPIRNRVPAPRPPAGQG